ncbi:alpha-D-ribose 1-methylphosphonate 5-phosphate C-P-lyase PhnJ [Meiothermus sp. CFH 77666]|uniref:alpha-D-ribose 1-methylphosphonate 5-phosphate C-P-lyase PhnJ n=1 Tax=Meiothermus sp. CFH 77666 TaxID=2817942 RepID=UPI001AA0433B|nr:alpha-D-ribose 1-methylphosphonate 5-phosphate C-P-lyase PhnJ [Meiothermus sp. CFH 77666]MBO1438431.1 alpha-D-ribose 1-methylphosphonate 5-phosphate C-P-lyase PhnJ [Meiothermus sp. CFH 77666]
MRLSALTHPRQDYAYAFLDAFAKRELRRKLLKAVAIPGYQVPYASREVPLARGWGTGGLQVTLALVGPADVAKVIDQGDDQSVNAANLRRFIARMAGVETTTDTARATLIQSRHRIPEERLNPEQIQVLQVPYPEPLARVEPSFARARELHADAEYAQVWLGLYEDLVRCRTPTHGADYPVMVHGRYLMAPSPIPRWDNPKLHQAQHLTLLSAGSEKRLYAVPPFTEVRPVEFSDVPFDVEDQRDWADWQTGLRHKFMTELPQADGGSRYELSDRDYARKRAAGLPTQPTYYDEEGLFYHPGYLAPRTPAERLERLLQGIPDGPSS